MRARRMIRTPRCRELPSRRHRLLDGGSVVPRLRGPHERDSAPMCASVCPSEALWFGTRVDFDSRRPGQLINEFTFGNQTVRTKVVTVVHDRDEGPLDLTNLRVRERWQDNPFGLQEVTP